MTVHFSLRLKNVSLMTGLQSHAPFGKEASGTLTLSRVVRVASSYQEIIAAQTERLLSLNFSDDFLLTRTSMAIG
jgi:hypothetical protein